MSAVTVGLVGIVLVVLATYLGFSKDVPFVNEPYEIQAAFRDSSGIKPNSPVRIAGVDVGEVTKVEHASPGARAAMVTMAIDDNGRPVHRDAEAKIRPRIFLEGNFFVDLRPGTPGAPEMDEGAAIPVERTANPVQFDQVLSALKSDTRGDLRETFEQIFFAELAGGAKAFNRSLEDQPDAYRFSAVVAEALLGEEPGDLGDWVRDQGVVSAALDRSPEQLQNLVVDFNATAAALADRQDDLRDAIEELPTTLRAAMPAYAALNDAFPDVRRFAVAARPGVRSTGPAVEALLPLVRQLRGLVGAGELRGLARDLRRATPPLTRLANESVPVLEQMRLLASCTSNVLVPWGNDRVTDRFFPATGPVHQEASKFLPGLAGESRSFDGNGQWFKVLGQGGPETISLGNGLFGTLTEPLVGVQPAADRTRPPLRPETACETQETPDLRADVGRAPGPVDTNPGSAAVRERSAKAREVAIAVMNAELKAAGRKERVLDRDATLADIRRLAQRTGLTGQLNQVLRSER